MFTRICTPPYPTTFQSRVAKRAVLIDGHIDAGQGLSVTHEAEFQFLVSEILQECSCGEVEANVCPIFSALGHRAVFVLYLEHLNQDVRGPAASNELQHTSGLTPPLH